MTYYFSNNSIFLNENNKIQLINPNDYGNIKSLTYICSNKTVIPNTLINLESLYYHEDIDEIPEYLTNLKLLYCNNTGIKKIPNTLINLEYLDCSHNPELNKIPKELINLKKIKYRYTNI